MKDNLSSGSLQNVTVEVAKYASVLVLNAAPFIGGIAADMAQRIIELAEQAQHNKEVFQDISKRVEDSLKDIVAHSSPVGNGESQDAYKNVLKEILAYVKEINKKDDGSSKNIIKKIMRLIDAKNTSEAYEKIIRRLDHATERFYYNVALDSNAKITDINENVKQLVQLTLLQKGVSLTDEEVEELRIEPSKLKDSDDKVDRGKIRKRIYIGEEVAVKNMDDISLNDIAKEVKIVMLLSRWGPIERIIGAYIENVGGDNRLFVVTEWMQDGNLREYLDKPENKSISWTTKLQIAEQIAKGLSFCNEKKVYHRDVRSKNVLLNKKHDKLYAKLTNFHVSRKFKDPTVELSFETYRWTAPEKLRYPKEEYSDKCEVYSFGILLWEISTHEFPFGNIKNDMEAMEKIKDGQRPNPFSEGTPEQYQRLVKQAWHQERDKRPKINELREQLDEMKKAFDSCQIEI